MKTRIKEVIAVEGRDDESAVKAAVDAEIVVTRGYKISEKTWDLLLKAYEGPGLIIFTDPDHAGDGIRARLAERFPDAKHAYLTKEEARKADDIGIENAAPEAITAALEHAHCTKRSEDGSPETAGFSNEDLLYFGLCGSAEAGHRRDQLGKSLGIGCANAKTFLSRLNHFAITKEEYYKHGEALFAKNDTDDHKQA